MKVPLTGIGLLNRGAESRGTPQFGREVVSSPETAAEMLVVKSPQ